MKRAFSLLASLALGGCATLDFNERLQGVSQSTAPLTGSALNLNHTAEARTRASDAAMALLQTPLSREHAVKLALVNNPEVQAALASHWGDMASAAQMGRIANPVFTFERLLNPNVLDLGRMLSVGLLDLITYPQRQRAANAKLDAAQIQLALMVVERVTNVRQAWTSAVAAGQSLTYAMQVFEAAEASAELARRMQTVGNFNKLQRARQQAFYADAATRLAQARHAATATREALVRALGLTAAQSPLLKLPDRLPDLPADPRKPDEVSQSASTHRLDAKLSEAMLKAALSGQSLGNWTSFTDIELSGIRNTEFERADGHKTRTRGYEVMVHLPLFDTGDLKRQAMSASVLAAINQHEATLRAAGSHLREAYSGYRTAFDIARHYRDEVVPLRKLINEENVLRYNGMIIGVFELLADTRDQISAVIAAINAQQQFWLADAALESAIMGRPTSVSLTPTSRAMSGNNEGGH